MLFRTRYNVLFRQFRLLTAQAGSIPAAIRLIFENCYKRIFLCFSHLRLRRRFHVSAELHALQGRNTRCEAASRRNVKKAFSAAASFFPFRLLLRDYQGRAALDSCLPRLESSGCFSGSLLVKWLALRAGQRQGGVFRFPPPYLWTPLSPQRVKGCSPLTNPKTPSKAEKYRKTDTKGIAFYTTN